jgi:hypothetical protein
MSDKQTTALILLFFVAFLFFEYNTGKLQTIAGIVTGKPATSTPIATQVGGFVVPPMPAGTGYSTVPYSSATTPLTGNNILLSQNTVNNAQLANQSGLLPVWTYNPTMTGTDIPSSSPAPASSNGQLNQILNGWETLSVLLGI